MSRANNGGMCEQGSLRRTAGVMGIGVILLAGTACTSGSPDVKPTETASVVGDANGALTEAESYLYGADHRSLIQTAASKFANKFIKDAMHSSDTNAYCDNIKGIGADGWMSDGRVPKAWDHCTFLQGKKFKASASGNKATIPDFEPYKNINSWGAETAVSIFVEPDGSFTQPTSIWMSKPGCEVYVEQLGNFNIDRGRIQENVGASYIGDKGVQNAASLQEARSIDKQVVDCLS